MGKRSDYTKTAIALHWLIALLIITIFLVGLFMVGLPISPRKLRIYSYHKWTGVTIFALMTVRLCWRITHPPEPLSQSISRWERNLAGFVHLSLYPLALAIPVTGWLMSSAAGYKVVYLGILPILDLIGKDKELAEFLKSVHWYMNLSLFVMFMLHVGGVFKHLFVDRDKSVLARMMPILEGRSHEVL